MASTSSHPPGHGAHIAGAPPRTVPERNGTATGRADFRRARRPYGRRCGSGEQARERRSAIQGGNRRPDRQACRRRDRTRPRGSQPDIDAASEACLGCPVQVLLPARAIGLGATARGALAADRESFRRVADDGRLDVRGRLVAALWRRARASSDRSRCPDGGARPRRLLPPGRSDPSFPPRRHRGTQRRVRRDHLAGWRPRCDAQLAQTR